MERNGKQVGCDAHDNNALVVRGSGSNRLVSMEREKRFLSFSLLFSSSFPPFLLVGAGVWPGSNKNESDGRSFATGCTTTTSVTRQLEKTLNENKWDQTRGDEGFSSFVSFRSVPSFYGEAGIEPLCVFGMRWGTWFRLMLCIFSLLLHLILSIC